jgi:hypothetical protein
VKADLIAVCNHHPLIPERGDRAIDHIVILVWRAAAMVGSALSAMVHETPIVVGVEITPNKYHGL